MFAESRRLADVSEEDHLFFFVCADVEVERDRVSSAALLVWLPIERGLAVLVDADGGDLTLLSNDLALVFLVARDPLVLSGLGYTFR